MNNRNENITPEVLKIRTNQPEYIDYGQKGKEQFSQTGLPEDCYVPFPVLFLQSVACDSDENDWSLGTNFADRWHGGVPTGCAERVLKPAHFFYFIYFVLKSIMYETFFGLKRRPFPFIPDVEAYLPIDFMEESRRMVERTVQKGEGISLIFGATGKGKTLLLRLLRQSLESEYTVALVSSSHLDTPRALFLQLSHDLRIFYSSSETVELRLQVLDFARQEPTRGVVLLFDDAQLLSPAILEEIRLLTDSTRGSVPLFRAVLAGTMDFEEKLTLPYLEAFNQRVASRCYLEAFSREETCRYIGRQTDGLRIDPPHEVPIPLFTEEAKRQIYHLTDGIPRLINQLCDTSLQCAAEKEVQNVDEALIEEAWANLQHIETDHIPSDGESELAPPSAVQEPLISPEQIEEIIDRKKKTFQLRQFDSVEFGTLTDSESELVEPESIHRSPPANEYKPPYPEDDDEFAELRAETAHNDFPFCRLQLHIPVDVEETDSESAIQSPTVIAISKRKLVLGFHKRQRKFWRSRLLLQIQYRLGLFAGFLRTTEPQQSEHEGNVSDMNAKSLQEYGAAVLEGRPPFVRKEPHYAYQTVETTPRNDVLYPDPKTGVPITLRWHPAETQETGRIGISYTEFLSQESLPKSDMAENSVPEKKTTSAATFVEAMIAPVVRTSLNASRSGQATLSCCPGLDESFEESCRVECSAVSLAELFRTNSSALQRIEKSAEFKSLDEAIQRQLDTVVHRLTKAAEKIEQAAEVSERAGQHVSQAAVFVETEVKSALPTYLDLFRELSEFQRMVSAELASVRQQDVELPKFRAFPRRQVIIERTVPTIDVELLFR